MEEKKFTKKNHNNSINSTYKNKLKVNLRMSQACPALKVGEKVNIDRIDSNKYHIDVDEIYKFREENKKDELVNFYTKIRPSIESVLFWTD